MFGYLTGATAPGTVGGTDAQLYGVTTGKTLDITRDLGEANQSELQVNVGTVLILAQKAGDVVLTNNMISPEELAFAMNKYFAGNYDIAGVVQLVLTIIRLALVTWAMSTVALLLRERSTILSLNMTLLAKLCVSRRRVTIRFI